MSDGSHARPDRVTGNQRKCRDGSRRDGEEKYQGIQKGRAADHSSGEHGPSVIHPTRWLPGETVPQSPCGNGTGHDDETLGEDVAIVCFASMSRQSIKTPRRTT
ncbi:hypothetical protein MRX96_052487 [Rhipicephalus microplus]